MDETTIAGLRKRVCSGLLPIRKLVNEPCRFRMCWNMNIAGQPAIGNEADI